MRIGRLRICQTVGQLTGHGAVPPPPWRAGEYNLRLGIMKELRPEMVATHQGSVGVHAGHAFIVEAAVSVGGRNIKPGLNIFRFANRIPLLFEVRGCRGWAWLAGTLLFGGGVLEDSSDAGQHHARACSMHIPYG